MKDTKIIRLIIMLIAFYLGCSYINAGFDFTKWTFDFRAVSLVIFVVVYCFSLFMFETD